VPETGYVSLMKRWRNIALEAIVVSLIVLPLVVIRLLQPQGDWRDVAHDLGEQALFVIYVCAFVFLVVSLFYLLWRGLLRPVFSFLVEKGYLQALGRADAPRERSVNGRWRHFIEIGIASVLLARLELGLTKENTPGEWVMARVCNISAAWTIPNGSRCDFGTIIVLPIIVDASMIFLVLWVAYSVWVEPRDQGREVK
jgi:hypothetical protein